MNFSSQHYIVLTEKGQDILTGNYDQNTDPGLSAEKIYMLSLIKKPNKINNIYEKMNQDFDAFHNTMVYFYNEGIINQITKEEANSLLDETNTEDDNSKPITEKDIEEEKKIKKEIEEVLSSIKKYQNTEINDIINNQNDDTEYSSPYFNEERQLINDAQRIVENNYFDREKNENIEEFEDDELNFMEDFDLENIENESEDLPQESQYQNVIKNNLNDYSDISPNIDFSSELFEDKTIDKTISESENESEKDQQTKKQETEQNQELDPETKEKKLIENTNNIRKHIQNSNFQKTGETSDFGFLNEEDYRNQQLKNELSRLKKLKELAEEKENNRRNSLRAQREVIKQQRKENQSEKTQSQQTQSQQQKRENNIRKHIQNSTALNKQSSVNQINNNQNNNFQANASIEGDKNSKIDNKENEIEEEIDLAGIGDSIGSIAYKFNKKQQKKQDKKQDGNQNKKMKNPQELSHIFKKRRKNTED